MRRGFILLLLTVAIAAPVLGQGSGYDACGVQFNSSVTGYGGVEVCEIPYACGQADGVCPERFSQGGVEDNKSFRTKPYLQHAFPNTTDIANPDRFDVFPNGTTACAPVGGNCTGVLVKNETSGNFTNSSYSCTTSTTTFDTTKTYRANCSSVPNVAGCEFCQDPDCTTNMTILVTDSAGNPVEDANVRFQGHNDDTSWEVEADSGELITDTGFTGQFNVTCGSDFYYSTQQEMYVQPGSNVLYCPGLEPAGCTPDGTSPNQYGEMVCRKACANATVPVHDACNGLPPSAEVLWGRENTTHVEYRQCCGDSNPLYRYSPVENMTTENIRKFQVREIQRELNGKPVKVNIIVYEEES